MSRFLRCALATIGLLFAFVATSAGAAPAPAVGPNIALPYPAKSPIVLHINGFERTRDRLAKMLEALPPAEGKQVNATLTDGLAQLLKNRKLDAVPKDGRVFLVVNDIPKLFSGDPAMAVLLPVTGYKEFKESLLTVDERKSIEKDGNGIESMKSSATGDEVTLHLVDLKGYVAITPSKDTAEVYAGKYTAAQSGAMGTDLSASYLNADVSLYVNMDVINDLYGDQIKQFKGLIDFALGQAQNMGMVPGLGKQQLDMAKVMISGLFQAIEDSKGLVIGFEFRPEGLSARAQVRFADDTQSADILKPETPTALAGLTKLPKGLSSYGGSKFGKKFTDLGAKFAQEFIADDGDEKGAERIAKLQAEIAAAGSSGSFTAGKGLDQSILITSYKDPQKALDATTKLYTGLTDNGKFGGLVLKAKPTVTAKAQSHRELSFTEIKMSFDFAASVEGLPEAARDAALAQFKRLASEKTTLWMASDGKAVIQIGAKDWATAKSLLDEYLDAKTVIGSDAGFQAVRKNLPEQASLLYLLETGEAVTALVEQAKTVGQSIPGGGFPALGSTKPVKGDPTYLGFALTLKPQVATAELFVPGTAMNVAVKMIAPLFRNVE
jgi:hypothetical protein